MFSDFQHEASEQWMTNLDNIIDGVNAEGSIKALYSTPSIYLKAKNAEQVQWTVKTDDFFPVSARAHATHRSRVTVSAAHAFPTITASHDLSILMCRRCTVRRWR